MDSPMADHSNDRRPVVPEPEHIGRVDVEIRRPLWRVSGERSASPRVFIARTFQEPVARAVGALVMARVVKVFDATRT